MTERDDSEFLTALAIGAVVGVAAALLFRSGGSDFDRDRIIKKLKPLKKKAGKAVSRAMREARESAMDKMDDARGAGRIIRKSSGRIAGDLQGDAAKIVRAAQKEIRASARDSVKQARRAMRQAAKRLA